MRFHLPHEISASIVAMATVFLTMSPLNLPTWAIFVTWAGTFLLGGPSRSNTAKMIIATTTGAAYGVIAVLLNQATGTMFGEGAFGKTLALGVVIFVVNGTLLATGRIPFFACIPGMFFGFASLFATYFGGFGFAPGNLAAAFISATAMCALGPLCAFLGLRLMFSPAAPEPKRTTPQTQAETPA